MTQFNKPSLVVEEWFHLSMHEITYSLGVAPEMILEIVDEGIISAQKDENDELKFDNEAYRRIRIVLQLNRDLGINLQGAGLALELLNEIDRLQALINAGKQA